MTQREIARLCCKVIAIYALIRAIESLSGATDNLSLLVGFGGLAWRDYFPTIFGVVPSVVLTALAVYFWRRAGVVAAWITGHDLQDDPDEPDARPERIDSKELQTVAFATLGLWAIIDSTPQLFDLVLWGTLFSSDASENVPWFLSQVALASAQLGLGVWLLFGSRGLVQLLYKLRNVGLDKNERLS